MLTSRLTYAEARYELMAAFDDDYGINSGVTHCEMSDNEQFSPSSLYEYWAEIYAQEKIGDVFKISFDDYIKRPSFLIESLNRAAERSREKEASASKRLQEMLNNSKNTRKPKRKK